MYLLHKCICSHVLLAILCHQVCVGMRLLPVTAVWCTWTDLCLQGQWWILPKNSYFQSRFEWNPIMLVLKNRNDLCNHTSFWTSWNNIIKHENAKFLPYNIKISGNWYGVSINNFSPQRHRQDQFYTTQWPPIRLYTLFFL